MCLLWESHFFMLTQKLIVSVIEFISTLNGSSIDNAEQNGLEKI